MAFDRSAADHGYAAIGSDKVTEFVVRGVKRPVENWLDCEGGAAGVWVEHLPNFNHVFNAVEVLLEVAMLSGDWIDTMNLSIDARGPGRTPREMHDSAHAGFYVAFIVIGSFYMLNIFVSVVIDEFHKAITI